MLQEMLAWLPELNEGDDCVIGSSTISILYSCRSLVHVQLTLCWPLMKHVYYL